MKNITLKASLAAVTAVSVALGTVTAPALATEGTSTSTSTTAAAPTTNTTPATESTTLGAGTESTTTKPTEPSKPENGSSIDRTTILTIINFLTGGKFSTILGLSKDTDEDEDTPQTPMQQATAWIKIIGSVLTALAGVIGLIGAAQGFRR